MLSYAGPSLPFIDLDIGLFNRIRARDPLFVSKPHPSRLVKAFTNPRHLVEDFRDMLAAHLIFGAFFGTVLGLLGSRITDPRYGFISETIGGIQGGVRFTAVVLLVGVFRGLTTEFVDTTASPADATRGGYLTAIIETTMYILSILMAAAILVAPFLFAGGWMLLLALIGLVLVLLVALGIAADYDMPFDGRRVCWLFARSKLARAGLLPWRLARFLDDAHKRGILRQVGGVYQFRHGLLEDFLALDARSTAHNARLYPERRCKAAHYNLAINFRERGRLAAAEDVLEDLAFKHRWVFPPYSEPDSSLNVWDVLELLGVVKAEQGRYSEAIDQLRQALNMKLRVRDFRPSPSSFFDTWIRLVQVLEHDGRLTEAIAELRTLLSVMKSASSEDGYRWVQNELHVLEEELEGRGCET